MNCSPRSGPHGSAGLHAPIVPDHGRHHPLRPHSNKRRPLSRMPPTPHRQRGWIDAGPSAPTTGYSVWTTEFPRADRPPTPTETSTDEHRPAGAGDHAAAPDLRPRGQIHWRRQNRQPLPGSHSRRAADGQLPLPADLGPGTRTVRRRPQQDRAGRLVSASRPAGSRPAKARTTSATRPGPPSMPSTPPPPSTPGCPATKN